jgi:hypothetical protein
VNALINAHANLDLKDKDGFVALIYSNLKCFKIILINIYFKCLAINNANNDIYNNFSISLIKGHVDVNIRDTYSKTALMRAIF